MSSTESEPTTARERLEQFVSGSFILDPNPQLAADIRELLQELKDTDELVTKQAGWIQTWRLEAEKRGANLLDVLGRGQNADV